MASPAVPRKASATSAPRTTQSSSIQKPQHLGTGSTPKATTGQDDSLRKPTSVSQVRRQSTVLVRKRLPWLDGPQQSKPGQVPGHFDSRQSLTLGDSHTSPSPARANSIASVQKRASAASLGHDVALRTTGSTPSLRQRAKSGDFKTLSLNSHPRPGVRHVRSKHEAKKVLGVVDEGSKEAGVPSSEYSTTPSTDKDEVPPAFPKRRASSYERLVHRRASTIPQSDEPLHHTDQWLQNLPVDQPTSPSAFTVEGVSLQPQVSPRSKTIPPARSESCASCDHPSWVREMPKAKTLPRRATTAVPPPPEPAFAPPPPPTRKSTLFAMPTHLLPSSSSSSHDATMSAVSPPVPVPAPLAPDFTARDNRRQSKSLNRAVTGLENLMEEALNVARNAAQSGRNDEVANVLDNATLALRKASTVQGRMNTGRMSQPLVLSPAASHESDGESTTSYSDASSMNSARHSEETAPSMFTKSAQPSQQPILVDQYKPGGQAPVPQKASFETAAGQARGISPDRGSISRTPPRLYQPPSADSIVRDFAYARAKTQQAAAARRRSKSYGEAADYYGDMGQSVGTQPGVRPSLIAPMFPPERPAPSLSGPADKLSSNPADELEPPFGRHQTYPVRRVDSVATGSVPPRGSRSYEKLPDLESAPRRRPRQHHRPHLSNFFESSYYHERPKGQGQARSIPDPAGGGTGLKRGPSLVTDTRYDNPPSSSNPKDGANSHKRYSDPSNTSALTRNISLRHPRRHHISLLEGQGFSLGRYHRRQPIAREWSTGRKRITAMIACLNTVFVGLITGIYAGEVPRIQYQLQDTTHKVILGNVILFASLGLTTILFWPLPLLHGRKPYTLLAFALMLPLMFPQALVVSGYRNPNDPIWRCGLLIPRAFKGIAMGFANINFLPTLFDLFGASLMSEKPHQEIVVYDDVRRQGGGVGVWLGIWSFCFVGSMSIGFCVGACIISFLSPSWGFYIIVILLAFFLLVNVIAPETRRAPYRRSIAQYVDDDEKLKRRVARGEVKLHISNDGPKWWFQEVWAGVILTKRMVSQLGFLILMLYLAWMYAQVTLVILLLGALLSRDYAWQPRYVGPAVLSVAIGAFLALPLSKANLFSRARDHPQRTDSMTMRHSRVTWSSHMLRRCIFTLLLPFAAIAYTLSAAGKTVNWATPTVFCGCVGFLSNLAIAECVGFIMETFDTCDLQPGVNQKHRLQSMAETTRRRRTNYSSFPRVCSGFFVSQGLGFILSAAATGVSGTITRAWGAQIAIAVFAGVLMVLTVLFTIVLWRWKEVQVIPNNALGTKRGSIEWGPGNEDPEWKAVVIGNPSGKMRRMNLLEMGGLSRWTEIRKLNKLVKG